MKISLRKKMSKLGKGALLIAIVLGGNCKTLTTQVEIQAPADKVMKQVRATEHYEEWNPFLRVAGQYKDGNELKVKILHKGEWMEFEPTVIRDEQRHIQWRGRFLMPGIFTGEHGFRVVQKSQDKAVFEHYENFSGILVPFFDFSETEKGFNEMNRALKQKVESAPK